MKKFLCKLYNILIFVMPLFAYSAGLVTAIGEKDYTQAVLWCIFGLLWEINDKVGK